MLKSPSKQQRNFSENRINNLFGYFFMNLCQIEIIYNNIMKKINNSFKEEITSLNVFVREIKKKLKKQAKRSKIIWAILSALVAILNITILVISFVALKMVLDDYNSTTKNIDFTSEVLPTAMVSVVSILIFIISIVISIYMGVMKSKIYRNATETIQYRFLEYKSKENTLSEDEFKKEIRQIYNSAIHKKMNKSVKKSIVSILIGGSDE